METVFALITLALYVAAFAAALGWQVFEYFRVWPHSKTSWWLLKLSVPLFAGLVLVIVMAAFPSTGMEALAGFYVGLLLAIVGAPVLIFGLARAANLQASACCAAAASLIGSVVVAWFSWHGIANQLDYLGSAAKALTPEAQASAALKLAAENPAPAGEAVQLVNESGYLLADGSILMHLVFQVDPELKVFKIDFASTGSAERFRNLTTRCVAGDQLHAFVTGRESLGYSVRSLWHRGSPQTMVAAVTEHRIPDPKLTALPRFTVDAGLGSVAFPVPVRRLRLEVRTIDGRYLTEADLADPTAVAELGMHARNSCLSEPLELPVAVDHISLPVTDLGGGLRRALPVWLRRGDP